MSEALVPSQSGATRRSRLALVRALCIVFGSLAASCGNAPGQSIILVTIDTLRADHLSGYGYDQPTSPNLDRLMARGATFSWAFAASSSTAPSHASIMTGQSPAFHSVGVFNGHFQLGEEVDTLAERLGSLGFRTAAVVSNPVLAQELGLGQGFEVYDDRFEAKGRDGPQAERHADAAVDRALAIIEGFGGDPFFLWVHVQDPHGPYDPPERWLEPLPAAAYNAEQQLPVSLDASGHRSIPFYQVLGDDRGVGEYLRRYDGEIAYADGELGRLVDYLDAHDDLRDALVIVTADHGEALGEDEFYFSHSHSLELNQVRVPLVIVGPGIRAGLREDRPVSNAWIFDTVLSFAAGAAAVDVAREEHNLLEPGGGNAQWTPGPVYMASLSQVAVAHRGRFLRGDRFPANATDVWQSPNPNSGSFWKPLGRQALALRVGGAIDEPALDRPTEELLRDYRRDLAAWNERFPDRQRPAPLAPDRLEALRSLGYVQ